MSGVTHAHTTVGMVELGYTETRAATNSAGLCVRVAGTVGHYVVEIVRTPPGSFPHDGKGFGRQTAIITRVKIREWTNYQ